MRAETPALPPEEGARLVEFARATKAAARAVSLYPDGHQAVSDALGRLVQLTAAPSLASPLRISVLTDQLAVDGHTLARPDTAVSELAELLHTHLIGELTILPGGDAQAWRSFLLLIARSPDSHRADGGITRAWSMMPARHVEIREIDYAELLRERQSGIEAKWDDIIAHCLQGQANTLDEAALRALLEAAADPDRLADLIDTLDAQALETGHGVNARVVALIDLLNRIIEVTREREPDRLESAVHHAAGALGRLSPEVMIALLARRSGGSEGPSPPGLVASLLDRMPDDTVAGFVARNAFNGDSSLERVAQAFQTLVPATDRRDEMLTRIHDQAAQLRGGSLEEFESTWESVVQKLITSYSDEPFVAGEYARELSAARTQAVDVERTSDDPPERLASWHRTVSENELRRLDLALVLDLLRIEEDRERWSNLMRPIVNLVDDLLLVGDFNAAADLLTALVEHAGPAAAESRRETTRAALNELVSGSMMHHIVANLAAVDDLNFERLRDACVLVGENLIGHLADALSREDRARPRERLTSMLIAFGATGRQEAERLKGSPNAAVRRTAIYLLREFGGSEALPQLTELLDDAEPQVQREAVRAILGIGTEEAYRVLQKALIEGTEQSREAIMRSLSSSRDEAAVPLLCYIVTHVDHRGSLGAIHRRAIEALGMLKSPAGIPALKDALYRGEWWAPRRTTTLRAAAALALAKIGTPEAATILEEAAASGPRGVRAAARLHRGRHEPRRRSS